MEKNEWVDMIYKVSDNIISSLGFTSSENYSSVKKYKSGLSFYENMFDIPEPFVGSLLENEKINEAFSKIATKSDIEYTKLEKTAILSVYDAVSEANIDPADNSVLFIFSTTKGNIELLENNNKYEPERVYLWRSAQLIAEFFDNKNEAVVVSNACISGVAAQITAARYLNAGRYKYIIVIGAEVLSKFIISGFQSFKALSVEMCKPFDKNRTGLNLGEAAATIIYSKAEQETDLHSGTIIYENGAVCNDANHISGPSRTAEGLFNAINIAMNGIDKETVSFINAHGTATPYNDDMESVAIGRHEMNDTPVNSLKPYFGHTLGAAGILETIISAYALQEGIILKSMGFEDLGVVSAVNINKDIIGSDKKRFLKLISGFGGSNAAIIMRKI
ncbi:MAG: beta-ketoacyl synthase [Bacteroidales bacterium]|jgi:3-oxoacyl-[acyl-carrier-protein] synthase-1|nr:beta-ketoacyl synthase [Bacteroidales bacterium]